MKAFKIVLGCIFVVVIIYFLVPSSYEIRNAEPTGETIICFSDYSIKAFKMSISD